MAVSMVGRGEWLVKRFKAVMGRFLERDQGRVLFGLLTRPTN